MQSPHVHALDSQLLATRHSIATEQAGSGTASSLLNPRRLRSTDLLDGEREIEIEHAGSVYRLRRTSLGKLILTK